LSEDRNHSGDPEHCPVCHQRRGFEDEKALLLDRLNAADAAILRLTPNMAECVARFAQEGDEVARLVLAEYQRLYADWRLVGIEASTWAAECRERYPR